MTVRDFATRCVSGDKLCFCVLDGTVAFLEVVVFFFKVKVLIGRTWPFPFSSMFISLSFCRCPPITRILASRRVGE
jgi:hypothetical protein